MALSPEDRIKAAKAELSEGKKANDEEKLRSSISKLYYGIYHKSDNLDKFLTNHDGIKGGGVHEQRISKFKNYPSRNFPDKDLTQEISTNIRSFGHMMNQLRGDRVKADYMTDVDITPNDADQAFANGMRALEKLESIYKIITTTAKNNITHK